MITRQNEKTVLTSRRVIEKGLRKIHDYISSISPEAPRRLICTEFGTAVDLADVVNIFIRQPNADVAST